MFKANKANKNPTHHGGNLSRRQTLSGTRQDTVPGVKSTNQYSRSLGDKMNAPANRGVAVHDKSKPKSLDAGARCEASFKGNEYGGDGTPTVLGSGRMSPGLGAGVGRDVHHGAARAQDNVKPKTAHAFASFDNVGGTAKKPTLG